MICLAHAAALAAAPAHLTLRTQHLSTVGRQEYLANHTVVPWDGAATAVEILLTDGGNPSPSAVWQTYTYDLATLFAGLDLAILKLVMVFPDFGNADGAVARLDNVMLAP